MATLSITKYSNKVWKFIASDVSADFSFSKLQVDTDGDSFVIVSQGGATTNSYQLADITVYASEGGTPETGWLSMEALLLRLEELNFPAWNESGAVLDFNLRVQQDGETVISNVNKLIFDGATVVNNGDDSVTITITGGGGGVTEFTELTDVPASYTGQGSKVVAVKADESGLEFVAGGGIANVIQRVFSVTLAQLGAVDFNDDIPAKIKAYAIANSITKAVNETHDWEVTENFNFDLEYTGTDMFDNWGIEDEPTFISFLESQGATDVIVTGFELTSSRLRCNLLFDGITSLFLSYFGINKINNLDALVNLNYLYLSDNLIITIENLDSLVNLTYLDLSYNQITTIENLDSLVNLTVLYLTLNQITTIENLDSLVNLTALNLSDNQITTTQFNILNSWAILAPINGSINTNNNTDNFNTSTTYTTLLGKGWSITL